MLLKAEDFQIGIDRSYVGHNIQAKDLEEGVTVILDLSEAKPGSGLSGIVQVAAATCSKLGYKLAAVNADESIRRFYEMMGLEKMAPIYPSREERMRNAQAMHDAIHGIDHGPHGPYPYIKGGTGPGDSPRPHPNKRY